MSESKLIGFVEEECTSTRIDKRLNMFFGPSNLVVGKTRSRDLDESIS